MIGPADARPNAPPHRWRWAMVTFAFAATIINYLDRQVLTMAVNDPDFKATVHFSDATYGLIGSAFLLAYAIMNGLSGPVIDYVGTRLGYAGCMLWWSLAGILHLWARGPFSLGLCRFLLGAGEAGNWPAATKLVGEWFPAGERALASGFFNAGSSIGSVLSPPLITWIILSWGWRSAFLAMGVLGLVWLLVWWLAYTPPQAVGVEEQASPIPVRQLLKTRFVLVFMISKVFMDPVWYFFVFWFPKYLAEAHHFSLQEIGWKGWIPYFTAVFGNLVGGWLTGQLIRQGVAISTARKAGATLFALLMLSLIPAVLVSNALVAIGLISIMTFGYTGYLANTLAFPAEVFPGNSLASIWGLASMGSGFGGMLFIGLSGWLVGKVGYTPVFIGYGLMPLLALACILFLMGPLRKISLPLP